MREDPKIMLFTHLEELRRRILIFVAFLFVVWAGLFFQFNRLVPIFLKPYQQAFAEKNLNLVFTSLPEAIMAALKSTFFLALAFSLPVLVFQAWRFLSPALYPEEKRFLRRFFALASLFTISGIFLTYWLVFPSLLKFFLGLGYTRFEPLLRIQSYLSFIGKGLLVAAIVAQIPIITAGLVKLELLPKSLGKKRYLYLLGISYALGLFISPGDFVGQFILAVGFFFLLQSGFLIAKLL